MASKASPICPNSVAVPVRPARRQVARPPAARGLDQGGDRPPHQPPGDPPGTQQRDRRHRRDHRQRPPHGPVDGRHGLRFVDADGQQQPLRADVHGAVGQNALHGVEAGHLHRTALPRRDQGAVAFGHLGAVHAGDLRHAGQDHAVAVGDQHRRVVRHRLRLQIGLEPAQVEQRRHHARRRAVAVGVGQRERQRRRPRGAPADVLAHGEAPGLRRDAQVRPVGD